MLRTFVAIAVPEDVSEPLAWMATGIPGARWIDPDDLHLTLRYAGEIEGHVFDDVARAVEDAAEATEPFSIALCGTGHFPPRREPRSIWVGVAPSEPLVRLYERVDRALVALRLTGDRRKFVPHVTLARLAGTPASRVARFHAENALFRSEPFEVRELHLYTSRLHPDGARYTRELTFPLGRRDDLEDPDDRGWWP